LSSEVYKLSYSSWTRNLAGRVPARSPDFADLL
jgi:hypothetical protein